MKKIWIGAVFLALSFMITACGKAPKLERYDAQFLSAFDTISSITCYAENEEQFKEYSKQFQEELLKFHQLYDIYNDYPDINNIKTINDNAGIQPVKVDKEIIDLLELSREMYEKTDGKINVAMGSVLSLWHRYRTDSLEGNIEPAIPPMDQLRKAAEHMDISKMVIDAEASTVYLEDQDMSLDVGAIAKGYAAEQVSRDLEKAGIKHGIINLGGNVRTIGDKADGSSWKVGVQNPDLTSSQQYIEVLELKEMSLVSSGNYQRYYSVDGKVYHHIIHPDLLMPWNEYAAVSILCSDSGLADGLSTAVFNMELEDGMALIESMEGVEALWVKQDGSVVKTSGFDQFTENS